MILKHLSISVMSTAMKASESVPVTGLAAPSRARAATASPEQPLCHMGQRGRGSHTRVPHLSVTAQPRLVFYGTCACEGGACTAQLITAE